MNNPIYKPWYLCQYKNCVHTIIGLFFQQICKVQCRIITKKARLYGEQVVQAWRLRVLGSLARYSTTIHLTVSFHSISALRCIYLSFSVLYLNITCQLAWQASTTYAIRLGFYLEGSDDGSVVVANDDAGNHQQHHQQVALVEPGQVIIPRGSSSLV